MSQIDGNNVDDQLDSATAVKRAEPAITVAGQVATNQIPDLLTRLASEFDDVVAHAPAKLGDESRALLVMADVAVFPTEPTYKSLRSTKTSVEVLNYARTITGGRPKQAWLVLNKVKKRTRIFRDVFASADELGLRVASPVRDLQAFPTADQDGTVVLRMPGKEQRTKDAQADLNSLFADLTALHDRRVAHG